jgi:hypothetical protein
MASKEELSEQLSITQKLAAATDAMARSMERVESSYDNQIATVEKLTQAIEALRGQDLSQLNSTKFNNVQKELTTTEKEVKSLTGRIKDMGSAMAKKLPAATIIGAAAVTGFGQGIRNVIALGKGLSGFFASFIDGAVNIAASIIAIPFKMFSALVDMAAQAGGGTNELAVALEKLREQMGDLKGPGTSAVLGAANALKGFSDTGLSAFKVFGTLAERIELVTRVAVAMGATFGVLTQEFKDNGGALLAFQKGLGVSDEGMKAIGDTAIRMGKPMAKVFLDMTKQTLALGKAFDIDQKLIGKDMVKALQSVKHFGAITVKEIAQASVYARKLGLELTAITGTLDAFETFDSAAENAAKLSQAFGVNIDAFKLMEAQNPAEQLEMLRKSFSDAGIDASKFTRQQAKLLAQTTSLDEATVRQAFATSNYGASLTDIQKKSETAEKKTMSQAEAMGKLADSIERMIKPGDGGQVGSFWQMFVKGFLGGIQSSKEFRTIIMNIKRSLNLVYIEGVKLGKAFVELFPGVKQFLSGIADFFRPDKFKQMVGGTVDILKSWMQDLSGKNGKASFGDLMEKLQKKFFNFFDGSTGAGKEMLAGFKTFAKTITTVLAGAIKWASEQVGEGIQYITDLVTGKKKLGDLSAGSDALGFLGEILLPLGEALVHAWQVIAPKLWELVKILGKKLYDYLTSKEFTDLVTPALPYIAAALFGPAFARALLGAGTAALGQAAIKLFTDGGTKKIMEGVAKKAAEQVMEASNKVASKGGPADLEKVGALNKAAGEATKPTGAKDWGVKDAVKLGLKLVAIAGAIAIGGVMMVTAIVAMKKILDAGGISSITDIIAPLAILGAMVIGSIPLMFAMKLAAKASSLADVIKGGLIISVAIGIVGVVAAGITYLLKQVGTASDMSAAGDLMLKMSLVFLAMVPLIFASMAIGVLASGPQAVALAAAAVGLAVIGVAIAEMAVITTDIVKEIAKLKIDATFQRKIDAFLGIMKAIQAFADTLVNLINMMNPTFIEFVTGTTSSFAEKANSARELLAEMVGQRGGNTGLIGIIETVMDSIKQLNIGGPGMAEAAEVFSSVMNGVTGFMTAAAPPEAFYTEGGSFINKLADPTHNFANLAVDVNTYATKMREGALEMLTGKSDGTGSTGILGLISKLSDVHVPNPEATKVVSDLINSTAQILKFITPDPEALKQFQMTGETSRAWGLLKTKSSELDTEGLGDTITIMGDQFKELLPVLMSSVITSVTTQAQSLDDGDIARVKVLGDILKIAIDLMTSMGNATKGAPVSVGSISFGSIVDITSQIPDLSKTIIEMTATLPMLMYSLVEVVKQMPTGKDFTKNLEIAKTLFSFIGEIPKLAESISKTHGKEGGDVGNIDPMVQSIISISTFMERLVGGMGPGGSPLGDLLNNINVVGKLIDSMGGGKVMKIADQMKELFGALSSLTTALRNVQKSSVDPASVGDAVSQMVGAVEVSLPTVSKIKDSLTPEAMKSVSESVARISEYGTQINKVVEVLKRDAIGTALSAASDMVKKANELDKALSDGISINTPTKLTKLAQAVGLGSKTNYTIRSKEIVLNVNLSVTMNVDEVEKIMIMRQSSIIRQRLNFATGAGTAGEEGQPPVPPAYQSTLADIAASGGD